ncbi:chemotaxis protein [Helicobacter sp. 12S02634-8]|uniref:chemotaxis protein n=1 Tax=Helicobacter sp. 12S02634-8 TaxID=1476199 RepID=UPI000BA6A758|nr:chemotaxis protein [Helicobacter sp. 12S02634-8]PAF48356.1 chemotaxis protein [Helicobacter sp. 12S02634-8]
MTQEELDALINSGDLELSIDESMSEQAPTKDDSQDLTQDLEGKEELQDESMQAGFIDPKNYKIDTNKKWPPPPPTNEHKVVHQLDDVTKDSEAKATEVFDQLEHISASASQIIISINILQAQLQRQHQVFAKLAESFPNIEIFKTSLQESVSIFETLEHITQDTNKCNDACMQAIDIMQFQDIHRQKIERVIHVMRALAKYMNSLFEGKIEDSKRVSSAAYIAGDTKGDLASEDDIEALIAALGKK